MQFINCTPHAIYLNDGRVFEPSGTVARVQANITEFDSDGIATQFFGVVENLPEPKEGTMYIVSALVMTQAFAEGRRDVVAPATGHPDCVRSKDPGPKYGFIISVPGFIKPY